MASSVRPTRWERREPHASYSRSSSVPRPTAGSERPPDRKSSVATSLASTVGLRRGRASTLVPNLSFWVRAAMNDSAIIGSTFMASETILSLSQSESMPRSSQASTYSHSSPGSL